jgi:hypothetical protein
MPATRALRFALGLALAAGSGAACSCSGSGPAAGPVAPAVIATPALTAGDAPVARVNGRTVWASCVAEQARLVAAETAGGEAERRVAALDQCVAFELLAQAAEARGMARAPEVGQAVRAAEVNRLVETEFEDRYRTPAALAPELDALVRANASRMHIPQIRASSYARFVVPPHAPAEVEARAHALADRLAAELAGQTGLYGVHLGDAARRLDGAAGIKLETANVPPNYRERLVDSYGAALYAISEVGRTSPALRTPWGWDVVLWTGGIEARDRTRDEMIAEIFPELRRQRFVVWADQIARRLGVHVEIDQAALGLLDTGGER